MITASARDAEQDTSPIPTVHDPGEQRESTSRDWRAIAAALAFAGMMVVLLWSGYSNQVRPPLSGQWGDVYRYQCFAVAFWQGPHAMLEVNAIRPGQCDDVAQTYKLDLAQVHSSAHLHGLGAWIAGHSDMAGRFHSLPIEYPVLALLAFLPPLLAPPADYPVAFGIEMTLIALGLFALLVWRAGWRAAGFFALCMGIGAWATGIDRFDLLPAGSTLVALLLAERRRWTWAYVALAAGIFLKYYPVVLVLPLAMAHLRSFEGPLRARLPALVRPIAVFVGTCVGLLLLSLAINPVIAYRQVITLAHRPLEVESVPATLVWLGSHAGIPMRAFVAFGSDNVDSALSSPAAALMAVMALVALATALSGLWTGSTSLRRAWLAALLAVIIAGKVFSAQYLIWLLPIAAIVVPLEGLAALTWLAACTLTTFSYPFLWRALHGGWHGAIALRNIVVFALLVGLIPAVEWIRWWQTARTTVLERRLEQSTERGRPWWAMRRARPPTLLDT